MLIDGNLGRLSNQDRISIRRRPGYALGGNRAAGARAVLDDHRLSERFAQAPDNDAADGIAGAAGLVSHNKADTAVGIFLSEDRRDLNKRT
jgi:hypothetical protein